MQTKEFKESKLMQKSPPFFWAVISALFLFLTSIFIAFASYNHIEKEDLKNIQRAIGHIANDQPNTWMQHPQTLSLLLTDNEHMIRYLELNDGTIIPRSAAYEHSGLQQSTPISSFNGQLATLHSVYSYPILLTHLNAMLVLSGFFGLVSFLFLNRCYNHFGQAVNSCEIRSQVAEKANLAKNSFLAHISHELRTPINGITSMNDLLQQTELNKRQSELVQLISGSSRILLSVANDLLDITRIENNELTLDSRQINLERITEDIGILMAADASERGLQLFVNYSPDLPPMFIADASRIRQIIMNLVSNAIKFTHLGHVYLTIERSPIELAKGKMTLRIKVEDTGVGLDPVEKQSLLSSLNNMPNVAERENGNHAGLGLTIVNQITNLMAGQISLESTVGKGSVFMVDLPLEVDKDHSKNIASTSPFKNMRLLLIDDHPLHRDIILQHLHSWGVNVSFTTEDYAVDKMKEAIAEGKPFDVTLFHESIQQASGTRFARTIRAEPSLKEAKLILLADRKQLYLSEEGSHKAFSMTIGKPVRPSELYDALFSLSHNTETLHTTLQPQEKEPEKLQQPVSALLVEDNHLSQQVAKLNLELLGCDVRVANNGEKALHLLRQSDFDIIFMDCHMPVLNGFETTERIRNLEKKGFVKPTPIIAITAEALIGDKEKCFQSGMDAYISKPYVQQDLREAIERWVIKSSRRSEDLLPETNSDERPSNKLDA